MDKRKFVEVLAEMDCELCKLLGDPEGETEVLRVLREFEKRLVAIADAQGEMMELLDDSCRMDRVASRLRVANTNSYVV